MKGALKKFQVYVPVASVASLEAAVFNAGGVRLVLMKSAALRPKV